MCKHLQVEPRFSRGRAIWCLAALPEADSQRETHYWPKIALSHYATMRATSALRMMPEDCGPEDRRARVWRSLRAGLAEGVRGSPLEQQTRQAFRVDSGGGGGRKRQQDEPEVSKVVAVRSWHLAAKEWATLLR